MNRLSCPPLLLFLLASPAVLHAHAVVFPQQSPPGAYEKYVLRVPNERNIPTVRVELVFPQGIRVVSFGEVTGWSLEVVAGRDGRIQRAVWTGVLPVERFIEFPFVAVNPDHEASLVWPAVQVYADGERVEWAGAENSATPASVTRVRSAGGQIPGITLWLSGGALLLALLSLGIALRRSEAR